MSLLDLIRKGQDAEKALDSSLKAKFGITFPQFQAMKAMHLKGLLTMGQLAELTGRTRGDLTAVIDRLERDGHVIRIARPDTDRRQVHLRLKDPAAFAAVDAFVKAAEAVAEAI